MPPVLQIFFVIFYFLHLEFFSSFLGWHFAHNCEVQACFIQWKGNPPLHWFVVISIRVVICNVCWWLIPSHIALNYIIKRGKKLLSLESGHKFTFLERDQFHLLFTLFIYKTPCVHLKTCTTVNHMTYIIMNLQKNTCKGNHHEKNSSEMPPYGPVKTDGSKKLYFITRSPSIQTCHGGQRVKQDNTSYISYILL